MPTRGWEMIAADLGPMLYSLVQEHGYEFSVGRSSRPNWSVENTDNRSQVDIYTEGPQAKKGNAFLIRMFATGGVYDRLREFEALVQYWTVNQRTGEERVGEVFFYHVADAAEFTRAYLCSDRQATAAAKRRGRA